MGVDCSLFLKKQKVYVHLDRLYAFTDFLDTSKEVDDFLNKLQYDENGVSSDEMLKFIPQMIDLNRSGKKNYPKDVEYSERYLSLVLKIVEKYPEDLFSLISDIQDEYYDLIDEYKEIEIT